jgi:D-alanyl-lipoteichoic acid acyltransferase DltB (MBOAT superfamily)
MSDSTVDLYSVQFWWVVALAMATLVPLTRPRARSWALAALNLGFLALLLRKDMLFVLALVAGAWLGLKLVARLGVAGALPFALAVLALFLAYKLPGVIVPEKSPLLNALTVIGFSYVTLRLIDVERAVAEHRHAPPGPAATVNYLLPFHMLAAGPIQSYDDFVAQPPIPPAPTARDAIGALDRIASGLFKKYILANLIDSLLLTGFRARGAYLLAEAPLTFLWLYLDFSAYSDVAVGVGKMIGVATPENFDRPYLARNIIEFWDRWHISLSQFIRRNVFIPIQVSLMRRTGGTHALAIACLAFAVSFLLCGLWHGVSWPWLGWGAFQAAGLIACNLYKHWLLKRLGRKGVNRYLENRPIRLAGMALTYIHQSIALAIAMFPYQELTWWTPTSS